MMQSDMSQLMHAQTHDSSDRSVSGDFPVLGRQIDGNRLVYLDSAATTLKPSSVIKAVTGYYEDYTANIHRGKHRLSEEASNRFEETRYRVAMFLRCQSNEIVFVKNTTEALNMVAFGLGLSKDDLVVAFVDSHHSNLLPWREHASVSLVGTLDDGSVDLEQYRRLLAMGPRVVALTHCSNVSGAYIPLEGMVAMAKEQGAIVVVDGAQSIPHRSINLRRTPIDFLAFSGHKMLGPSGVGILFGRQERLEGLMPTHLGGGMVDWASLQSSKLRKIPHRFEAGTPPIEAVIGLAAAIDYLEQIGFETLESHDRLLSEELVQQASDRDYLEVVGPVEADRAALLSIAIPQIPDLGDVARALSDGYGIMTRSGHLCAQPYVDSRVPGEVLRISAYLYNTREEIASTFFALDKIVGCLAR